MQLSDFLLLAPRKMKPLQNRTLERKRILLKNSCIMDDVQLSVIALAGVY